MAVYTHISEEDLRQHLRLFEIGEAVSLDGIVDGVENTNYRLVTTQGTFILTLFEKRVAEKDLPFFISFMEFLHRHGIPAPDVISAKDGRSIVPVNGKPAAITTFLEGAWPRKIEAFHVEAVGKTLAQMHLAVRYFREKRANSLSIEAWRALISQCGDQPDLQRELDHLGKSRPHGLPEGAVHADLFPDNVFFTGPRLTGVIDFYFSCTEAFVYDLMLTLNAWCFDPEGNLDPARAGALLGAYQKIRPLSDPEKASLNYFGRAAAMRIIATRLYDRLHPVPGAEVRAKDPQEYLRILKFHQMRGFAT